MASWVEPHAIFAEPNRRRLTLWRGLRLLGLAAAMIGLLLGVFDAQSPATALAEAGFGLVAAIFAWTRIAADRTATPTAPPRLANLGETLRAPWVEAMLGALPDPIIIAQTGGKVTFANRRAREALRLNEESLARGAGLLRNPALLDAIDRALRGEATAPVAFAVPGGVERHWRVDVVAMEIDGVRAALACFHDETERLQIEQMRADFIANASHELRTPLASLIGFIETLRGHAKNDPAARENFLGIMETQAQRMRRLVDDLLSLSRIEVNEHVPPNAVADLRAITRSVLASLRPLAARRSIELVLLDESEAKSALWVAADVRELEQVVQNLTENAIKYCRASGRVTVMLQAATSRDVAFAVAGKQWAGGARIALASPAAGPEARFTTLRVEDQGPGIAREYLPRLAERFYRVPSLEDHATGTGLGLAIVKHVVNRCGGLLAVESSPGVGSAFSACLPEAGPPQAKRVVASATDAPVLDQMS